MNEGPQLGNRGLFVFTQASHRGSFKKFLNSVSLLTLNGTVNLTSERSASFSDAKNPISKKEVKEMNETTKRSKNTWKLMLVLAALSAWASLPFLTGVRASGGDPISVRTATLAAPSGSINPHGSANFKVFADGSRSLEVEVEDLSLPAGTILTAFVDGANIGQLTVGTDGRARLQIESENGPLPTVNTGSTVQVRNGNIVLVAGSFGAAVTPTPTPTGTPTGTPTASPSASPTVTPNDNENEIFATLSGPVLNGVLPRGFAEFEVQTNRTEFEVDVRNVNLTIGTSLSVVVDNVVVGNLVIRESGEGELKLRTDNGQTVPVVSVGSTIAINNGAVTILSGTFNGATPTPTPTGSPTPNQGRFFEAHLLGSRMTPPVTTNATGEIKVTLSQDETQAMVFGEFHGLSSDQTGARIETTTATVTTVFDLGVVGGTNGRFISHTFPITAAQVQHLRTGMLSAVITSVNHPNGEIRGSLLQDGGEGDFDGDGSDDFALFRPSTGAWYSLNSSGFSASTFGTAADIVVSGDYDGDGKTDTAVFQNVNGAGVWNIRRSSDGGVTASQFGLATDIPVRGDFDGDGRMDLAVFRPSTGVWWIQKSDNSGFTIVQFGLAGDKPMPVDMDGDGRDDIAVFRPSEGNWYWINSSNGKFGAVHFGLAGDIPVRGDFDGDGKSDPTVFRPSTGVWYTLRSTDGGFRAVQFGLNGDIPVAGDYDADGTADIAVFRPLTGTWYILRSSDGGFEAGQFGLNGDIPVVAR